MEEVKHKQIKDFENYEIFEDGQVYSIKTKRFLKQSIDVLGNHQVVLSRDAHPYNCKVAKLVAEAFVENPDPSTYQCVRWRDGNRDNNYAGNLFWDKHPRHFDKVYKCEGKLYHSLYEILKAHNISYEEVRQ